MFDRFWKKWINRPMTMGRLIQYTVYFHSFLSTLDVNSNEILTSFQKWNFQKEQKNRWMCSERNDNGIEHWAQTRAKTSISFIVFSGVLPLRPCFKCSGLRNENKENGTNSKHSQWKVYTFFLQYLPALYRTHNVHEHVTSTANSTLVTLQHRTWC